jgi:DNA-binding SARP family transcriptional activator
VTLPSRYCGNGALSLSLLDGFELRCAGEPVALPPAAQRLLAFVALDEQPRRRLYLAGMLWTDATEARAAASLRSSLWRLQRPGHRVVATTSTHVGLAHGVDVDLRGASALAHGLLDGSADWRAVPPAGGPLEHELLPDWYDDWALLERERFRQLALHALETAAERQLEAGLPHRALETALAVVRRDPLRESAHRLVIRVHLAEGNAVEALRQHDLCRRLLRERLGVEPSPQLESVLAGIRPLVEDRVPRLDVDCRAGQVADRDPVGDRGRRGPLDGDVPLDLRRAGVRRGRHHRPDHVPLRQPVVREPALAGPSVDGTRELHADDHPTPS